MVYGPNGECIMAPMEYTLKVYSPKGKGMLLRKIVFQSGNRHGKRLKKYNIKDTLSFKISFMHYMK